MEKQLEKVLDDVCNTQNVIGCVLANNQGLCLGAKGTPSSDSAGMITAIMEQACKLEPKNSKSPTILLESDKHTCIIQKSDMITAAIYKNLEN